MKVPCSRQFMCKLEFEISTAFMHHHTDSLGSIIHH